jgi:ribosomal protein S18 acetylase RimI-like enzyme
MAINAKLESNIYNLYREFSLSEEFIYRKNNNYEIIDSVMFNWPNYIFNLNTTINNEEDIIIEISNGIDSKIYPPFIIFNPINVSSNFEKIIFFKGLRKIVSWPIMLYDNNRNENLSQQNSDFYINIVSNENGFNEWGNIILSVLFKNNIIPLNFLKGKMNNNKYKFLIGYINEKPISTAMIYFDGNISGIYMIATIPEYRGKGYGTLITRECINQIYHERKNDKITLQSTEMGFPVYSKIGFNTVGQLDIYWMLNKYHTK